MAAEMKRQEAWRQVEKSDLTEGNMEGGRLTLKLTERVMTADGVKYTCHCDWENCINSRGFLIHSESWYKNTMGCSVSLSCLVRMVSDVESKVSFAHQWNVSIFRNCIYNYESCC